MGRELKASVLKCSSLMNLTLFLDLDRGTCIEPRKS
jgi:hypothetical protein